jgi:hypothetical protein
MAVPQIAWKPQPGGRECEHVEARGYLHRTGRITKKPPNGKACPGDVEDSITCAWQKKLKLFEHTDLTWHCALFGDIICAAWGRSRIRQGAACGSATGHAMQHTDQITIGSLKGKLTNWVKRLAVRGSAPLWPSLQLNNGDRNIWRIRSYDLALRGLQY